MIIPVTTVRLHTPWVQSLKEKRMVVKSLLSKLRTKFNIAAAEVDEQDTHKIVVIAVVAIAADMAQADSVMDHVLNYIEGHRDAEVIRVEREIR